MADKPNENKKPRCFIAMPISTPENLVADYGGDTAHFAHVLAELFMPAIEDAGFDPIPPIAAGSEIIHADIIDNLVKADLVFVDMSTLNANVFFEFGIRSALNKPVCLVRDDKTPKIPFDAGTANHHPYNSCLQAWVVKEEKPKITAHVKASANRSKGVNSLWQHFGVKAVGDAPKGPTSTDDKLDYVMRAIESLTASRTVDPFSGLFDEDYMDRAKNIASLNRVIGQIQAALKPYRNVTMGAFDGKRIIIARDKFSEGETRMIVDSFPSQLTMFPIEFTTTDELLIRAASEPQLLTCNFARKP